MANINYSLLTTCRLVRDRVLLTIDEQAARREADPCGIALLDKVKTIEFTILSENYFVSLEQIAGYYDLDLQSLREIVELAKYRQELQENGVNFMYAPRSGSLRDRSSNQRVLLINGQTILRLALILSDRSLIALSIRNLLVSRQYSQSAQPKTIELVKENRSESIAPLCA
ncbi:MAG: hypothetical protein QNJ38_22410 [Prochloraceae cyanobacterium]|nr:hypothetical protein [Prochloraceae cyanobacterium]